MTVSYRTHNTSDCQTVKIVIDKDHDTQNNRCNLCTHTCLNVYLSPTSKCCRTSRTIHQTHDRSQNYQEDQNTHIVTVSQYSDESILYNMCNRFFKCKVRIKYATNHNTYKQRTVYFLSNQCKRDCHYRRNQRPKAGVHIWNILFCSVCCKCDHRTAHYH